MPTKCQQNANKMPTKCQQNVKMTQMISSKTTLHTMTFSKTMIQTAIVKLKQNHQTIRANVNLLNVVVVNVMAPNTLSSNYD